MYMYIMYNIHELCIYMCMYMQCIKATNHTVIIQSPILGWSKYFIIRTSLKSCVEEMTGRGSDRENIKSDDIQLLMESCLANDHHHR